jgi:drug/metabolite transporter (DMT)-like permease
VSNLRNNYLPFLLFDEYLENYHYIGTTLVFSGVYLVKKKMKNVSKI